MDVHGKRVELCAGVMKSHYVTIRPDLRRGYACGTITVGSWYILGMITLSSWYDHTKIMVRLR